MQDFIANLPQVPERASTRASTASSGAFPCSGVASREGGAPGCSQRSVNELFGFLRGAAVPYLKGGVELIIVSGERARHGALPGQEPLDLCRGRGGAGPAGAPAARPSHPV